ncbi:hypothetical protein [Fusobacterium animalis]|uniref:hypothetical protein n=1 Tax=Fusobacterium animalis TaxID=76859 RepID=UPI0030CD8E7F
MILKTYYNNNPNIEKLEKFFEEKEYEICLIGVLKILEDVVENKTNLKEEVKKDNENILQNKKVNETKEIDEEDYIRI